ncbi:hypothetical protein UFOVP567_16 [uncultured Caudovirales phage]|uniref:Uncharacterized protein n=1 Tax=uncultured Caudovirales phage TaxID=2100421 RepID=A0A6J5MZA7_9CAUD|nr:hypothetical protein UFOVP567_16 [uncultured Caudovirales phage]
MSALPTESELANRFGGTWTATPLRWSGVVERATINLWSVDASGELFVAIAISESKRKVCEVEGPDWSLLIEAALDLVRRQDSFTKPTTWKEDLQ